MYRQSPRSRGQRSNKRFKVKHGLQLILMLGVVIWVLYQTLRSYNHKDKSLGQGAHVSEQLRLGRKDLPDFGDAETATRESGDVKFGSNKEVVNVGGSEKKDEVVKKRKENGGNNGFKSKVDDKKEEVKKVGDGGEKNEEDEKRPSGEMKGVEKDGRIKNLSSSNDQVKDGSENDEKVMIKKQNKDKENGFVQDASVKLSSKESNEEVVSNVAETIDSSEDKLANTTTFSDETFASHSQNETDDRPGAKTVKGETGVDFFQSDSNADPMLKTGDSNSVEGGDSTVFSDTNGNEEANGVENPRPSTFRANEKTESEQHDTSHNSSSQEQKADNIKEQSSNVKKDKHEQVESSNKVSHHEEEDSSVSREVNDPTILDTLPDSNSQTHSKDAVAL